MCFWKIALYCILIFQNQFNQKLCNIIRKKLGYALWLKIACPGQITHQKCLFPLQNLTTAYNMVSQNFDIWFHSCIMPLISHTGILMTFYLSIILDLQNFFHWYILQSWKLKRPPIQLRPHHFWTCTSNSTTVVNSVLKFMISGTTSILKS